MSANMNMITRTCGCPDVGRTMRANVGGVESSACSCCGTTELCAKLPAGGGAIFNCATCLNPRSRKTHRRHDLAAPKRFEKLRRVVLPNSLLIALDRDVEQIRNDAPSAQRQKRGAIRDWERTD